MNNNNLIKSFSAHIPQISGLDEARASAVCVPFIKNNTSEYELLFEVRSSKLDIQPGDICFPGGMLEKGESPQEAALRETCEELLIKPENVRFFGRGDMIYSGSSLIHTFAAELTGYDHTFNEESDEVFTVPLEFFLNTDPEKYILSRKPVISDNFPYDRINGGKGYAWRPHRFPVYFYQYENRTIWGITARIIKDITDIIKKS